MNVGDVALAALSQADGRTKPRPVILLLRMPPFGDWLVCGISTQLRHEAREFDELIVQGDPDYVASGLKMQSLIRLGFLATFPDEQFLGRLGTVSRERHQRLVRRLGSFLQSLGSSRV